MEKIFLETPVKVQKNWRDDDKQLKRNSDTSKMSNIVAIVGRPNVGKSTLFNRLTESKALLQMNIEGYQRQTLWKIRMGRKFSVIDTGGYITGSEDIFEGEIRKQVELQ